MQNIGLNVPCDLAIFYFPNTTQASLMYGYVIKVSDGSLVPSTLNYLSGENWQVTFTPTTQDIYIVQCRNETLDITQTQYFNCTGGDATGALGNVMGQFTVFELFNRILKKLRNAAMTSESQLLTLSRENQFIWDTMEEVYIELATISLWTPLRVAGAITLSEGINQYLIPEDMHEEDQGSFVLSNIYPIGYSTADEINNLRADRTQLGIPRFYYREGAYFKFDYVPASNCSGQVIVFYYFKLPNAPEINYPSNKLWIPSPFDLRFFVNKVVERVLADRGNPKYAYYGEIANKAYIDMKNAYEYVYRTQSIVQRVDRDAEPHANWDYR